MQNESRNGSHGPWMPADARERGVGTLKTYPVKMGRKTVRVTVPESGLEVMFLARLDTRHFTFQALAGTEAAARGAIEIGWRRHAKEYGAGRQVGMYSWSEIADDVQILEMRVGWPYRDEQLME